MSFVLRRIANNPGACAKTINFVELWLMGKKIGLLIFVSGNLSHVLLENLTQITDPF